MSKRPSGIEKTPFRWGRFALIVLCFGLCYIGFLVLGSSALEAADDAYGFLALLLCAFFMGVLASGLWDVQARGKFGSTFWVACWAFLVTTVPLIIASVETLICVAMAAPIVGFIMALGILVTRFVVRVQQDRTTTRYSTLFLLPVVLMAGQEYFLESDFFSPSSTEVLVSEIVIDAPPEVIWAHTLEIAEISPEERRWTASHVILGAPQPIDATVDGDIRSLRWTKGVQFQEHITAREDNRYLAWRFVFHKPETLAAIDPNIHPQSRTLFLQGGSYRLTAAPEGRTRLMLSTTYTLKTPINGYLRLWGSFFLDDFQSSVLGVIKARAEATT